MSDDEELKVQDAIVNGLIEHYKAVINQYKTEIEQLKSILSVKPQSCEDIISRQAVLDMLEDINTETDGIDFDYEYYIDYIKNLPPVTQDCDTCEVGNPCLYCKHEFEEKPTDLEEREE